ncbi:UNVERIFIED_CONTAM: hypothetical protein Sangu_2923700 [Sesamum angustifolium]|uniref:Bet v I/Major latex protein domain-containing protein n=1 Tax=Sesamum angustifolium TaxID=2727405 RepID=A0AAW2IMV7_9LAMI
MEGRVSEEIEVKGTCKRSLEALRHPPTRQYRQGSATPPHQQNRRLTRRRLRRNHPPPLFCSRAGPSSYKEKFTVVEDERRVKETEVVEGGYLDLGFTLYRVRFEVVEKEGNKEECVTRSTVEYELKEEAAANAALVSIQPLVAVMQAAADYLTKNYNTTTNNV